MPDSIRPKRAERPRGTAVGWRQIIRHWDAVALDLHEVYGADWDDPDLDRPWPWWRDRILGLLSVAPLVGPAGVIPATRLGRALEPRET